MLFYRFKWDVVVIGQKNLPKDCSAKKRPKISKDMQR